MKCLFPFYMERTGVLPVPCGKCVHCLLNNSRDWSTRLFLENTMHSSSVFLTLTFSNDYLPDDGSISKRDLQLFFKRLRKRLGDRKVRYFACGEYGDRYGRPHYHAIVFGLSKQDISLIRDSWSFGYVHLGCVSYKSISYVTSYVLKKRRSIHYTPDSSKCMPFVIMSRRNGLGYSAAMSRLRELRSRGFFWIEGFKRPLTRYIRNLIFTAEERSSLLKSYIQDNYDILLERRNCYFIHSSLRDAVRLGIHGAVDTLRNALARIDSVRSSGLEKARVLWLSINYNRFLKRRFF